MSRITIEGMGELLSKITRLQQLEQVRKAMTKAAEYVRGKAATYPSVSRRPQPFVSDKQRRGFFAKLKSGEIEVPYRRGVSRGSERLKAHWDIKAGNYGLTQTIYNNTSYGPLVQGPQAQTGYHATTGWRTTEQVVETEAPVVVAYLRRAIEQELK